MALRKVVRVMPIPFVSTVPVYLTIICNPVGPTAISSFTPLATIESDRRPLFVIPSLEYRLGAVPPHLKRKFVEFHEVLPAICLEGAATHPWTPARRPAIVQFSAALMMPMTMDRDSNQALLNAGSWSQHMKFRVRFVLCPVSLVLQIYTMASILVMLMLYLVLPLVWSRLFYLVPPTIAKHSTKRWRIHKPCLFVHLENAPTTSRGPRHRFLPALHQVKFHTKRRTPID